MRLSQRLIKLVLLLVISPAFAMEGDAERGSKLVMLCAACHGQDGNSLVGTFPNIAGQNDRYLVKQMSDMKTGARSAPLMTGMLDAFDEQQLRDIAAFYSSKKAAVGAANPVLAELGETIYRSGVKRKQIAACTACHSPTGQGNDPAAFPALSGQWPEYTEAQLKAFRSGDRQNDGDSRMMRITSDGPFGPRDFDRGILSLRTALRSRLCGRKDEKNNIFDRCSRRVGH